jgi:hypothetical protein
MYNTSHRLRYAPHPLLLLLKVFAARSSKVYRKITPSLCSFSPFFQTADAEIHAQVAASTSLPCKFQIFLRKNILLWIILIGALTICTHGCRIFCRRIQDYMCTFWEQRSRSSCSFHPISTGNHPFRLLKVFETLVDPLKGNPR